MNKKNIFIALASSILGGPGKGLEQFLRYGGLSGCNPVVINYKLPTENKESDFESTIKNTGSQLEHLMQYKRFDLGLVNQALSIIDKYNIDILQSHGYKSHMLCLILHYKTKLPWIAFVHGWTHENTRVRLYAMLEQVLLLGATKVVAVSESLRSRLIYHVRKHAIVIPNALAAEELKVTKEKDALRNELGISEDSLVISIVGRLSPEKGHNIFFKAIANIIKQGVNAHALVVGDGQEHDKLQKLIKELDIEKSCSFVGHVRDTANYYNITDIQVMPSTTEGMPNAALEGMYMGLPIIATNVGGIPEVVIDDKTGILIPSGDVSELTRALLELTNNPEKMKNFGMAGKERVEKHFNPNVRAHQILALYDAFAKKNEKGETYGVFN